MPGQIFVKAVQRLNILEEFTRDRASSSPCIIAIVEIVSFIYLCLSDFYSAFLDLG